MKRSRKLILLVIAAAFGAVFYYLYAGTTVPAGQPPLVRLTPANFDELRTAFNDGRNSVRVVTLLSPT